MALAGLGDPAGEVIVPLLALAAIAMFGWHAAWLGVAVVLAAGVVPLLWGALRDDRARWGQTGAHVAGGLGGPRWRRQDAAGHWLLPPLLPVLLTPGFIGTVIFFHQAHFGTAKGWTLAAMAPGYSAFALATATSAFVAGWAADRFGAPRLLPVLLLPMGLGIALVGSAQHVATWCLALGAIGVTQGMASVLRGVLLPVA